MARPRGRSAQSEARGLRLGRSEWVSLANEWIFSERDRYIFVRHVLDGIRYEQLNKELTERGEYELSDRHLARIIGRCLDTLASHIDGN